MATSPDRHPLRVVLFVAQLAAGGAERQIVELAKGLSCRGHQAAVWTLVPGGALAAELRATPEVELESLYRAPTRNKLLTAWRLLTAAPRLRRALRCQQVDVLYSFLYPTSAIAGLAVGRRSRRRPCRWVLGVRSTRLRLNWKRAPFFRLCAWLSPRADLLVANSRSGLDAHVERGFRTRDRWVVANGVDVERFHPSRESGAEVRRQLGIAADAVVVGRVGRLTPVKDHPTFLRAAARLHARYPTMRFLCVGGGPVPYAARLEALGRDLGLSSVVVWSGERQDLAALYGAMDVAVSCSLSEGFPNVVAEAMACGVPCVVTNVGESAWVVGEQGRVVAPGDADALAAAIEDILQRPPDGAQLRRRVEEELSVERMVRATEEVLREATAGEP